MRKHAEYYPLKLANIAVFLWTNLSYHEQNQLDELYVWKNYFLDADNFLYGSEGTNCRALTKKVFSCRYDFLRRMIMLYASRCRQSR